MEATLLEVPRQYNAVHDFLDRNIADGFGDKPAFVDPHRELTYLELQTATNRIANVLTDLAIRRESRVAMLMLDTVDFPIVFWGSLRAGVIPVCLNTLLTTDQYEYLLSDSRAEALFISAELLPTVAPLLDSLESLKQVVVIGGDDGHQYKSFGALLRMADADFPAIDTCSDEIAFWLYSSGSTGNPKGVRHVHSSLTHVALFYGKGVLGIEPDDTVFAAAKLFFAYGLGAGMAIPMSVGATTVLLPDRPTPQSVLDILHTHNPTLFFGVPTLFASMLDEPTCLPENSSAGLRLCISAGEALPADVGKAWKQRMGIDIVDGVGSTEMLNAFLSNRPDDVRYGTSGREFDGYRLKLVDEDGAEVGDNEIGELLVSGGSAANGYWNQREKSRNTFAGIWTRTGDKYYRDTEGYYHYCGRNDDMFKVGGRWVSPFEVEQALSSHPAISEAAVVAEEDGNGLIKPKAVVVLAEGASSDRLYTELKNHVKSAVGAWKYPRWITIVDELPRTATGKIQRYKLRRQPDLVPGREGIEQRQC